MYWRVVYLRLVLGGLIRDRFAEREQVQLTALLSARVR